MANASPFHSFYSSAAWLTFSSMIRASRFSICELCGAPDAREVHHLVHIKRDNIADPAVTLNADNVMLLCRHCHYAIHERGKLRARRSSFDALGNIINVHEPSTSSVTPLQASILRAREENAKRSIAKFHQLPPS